MNHASEHKFSARRILERVRPLPALADTLKKREEKETTTYTVQVADEDCELLRRYGLYLTGLARLTGEDLPEEGRWTRKSLSEAFIADKCDALRAQLQAMFAACGDLPDGKDKAELARYVARVYAWSENLERSKK